jgi:hypothetical protein
MHAREEHAMIPPSKRPQFLAAIRAYARWCRQHQVPYRHPDDQLSAVGYKYVTLRNRTGLLARYNLETRQILLGPAGRP